IAAGGTTARANSGQAGQDSARASIGANAGIVAGDLSLSATGLADNYSEATPGSGGLVSGVSADASTRTLSASRALIGDGAVLSAANTARFEAAQENRVNNRIDAGSYGVIAGAGAKADNVVTSVA